MPSGRAALRRLTYPYDRETLAEARPLRRKTRALVVLRHGQARSARAWQRRTTGSGRCVQLGRAPGPAAGAGARGLRRHLGVVTSTSVRCVQTVTPYADTTGWPTEAVRRAQRGGRHRRGGASSSSTSSSTPGRARCCAPTGRCCRRCFDALGLPEAKLEPGGDAGGAPPQGPGRRHGGRTVVTPPDRSRADRPVHVIVVSRPDRATPSARFEFTARSPTPTCSGHLPLPNVP